VLGRHSSALERGPVQARVLGCPSGVRAEGACTSASWQVVERHVL